MFINEDEKVKHTNIATIYWLNKNKVFTKVIKTPSWKVWVQEPSGLMKNGGKWKHF
jgi:hypothetical protein